MRWLKRQIWKWPFTLWALLALGFGSAIGAVGLLDDDGPVAVFVSLSRVVWAFMFWIPDEVLFSLNHDRLLPFQDALVVVLGLAFSLGLDRGLSSFRARRQGKNEEH